MKHPKQARPNLTKPARSRQSKPRIEADEQLSFSIRAIARRLGISEADALTVARTYGLESLKSVSVITLVIADDVDRAICRVGGPHQAFIRQAIEEKLGMKYFDVMPWTRRAVQLVEDMRIAAADRKVKGHLCAQTK